MKLIELLARELKEWPSDVEHVVQDGDGEIKFGTGEAPYKHSDDSKVWIRDISCGIVSRDFPLADDWNTAIVTHDEWENATNQPFEPIPGAAPTLETMLTEWRNLEARAQAAQAEADALFEHAGQCHGEIVVRLAELGWGAPRGPMVPGEPVVTLDTPLDMTDWRNLRDGDIIECCDDGWSRSWVGRTVTVRQVEHAGYDGSLPIYAVDEDGDDDWGMGHRFISRPSAQQ